ncbi:HEAT repeat domain-containing protein [Candidatus Micrarchaeota archaeon]|nr:HEAT repeat domain-containing protein [Candidatus Micrarchaeota archaeon]
MRICRIMRPLLAVTAVACQHPVNETKAPSCETIMQAESPLVRELKCSENKWSVAVKAVKLRAVPELRKALKDDDPEVRQVAAYSLGMIGDISAVMDLGQALEDNEVKGIAAKALISIVHQNRLKPEAMNAVVFLSTILRDRENRETALSAMEILASKYPADARWNSAIPALAGILKEGYSKAAGTLALIRCGPESALTKAIKEIPELRMRTDILKQLEHDNNMITAVIELLSLKGKEFLDIREAAASAITTIAENNNYYYMPDMLAGAVPLLIDMTLYAETCGSRKKAIIALGAIGHTDAVPVLVRLLGSSDCNRCWAAQALGQIAEKNPDGSEAFAAIPVLTKMLDSEDQNERIVAFEVMEKIKMIIEENRKTINEGEWPSTRGPKTKANEPKEGEWPTRL